MRGGMMMRTANPALNAKIFDQAGTSAMGGAMTLQGTINKTFILLVLIVMSAAWVWGKVMQPAPILDGVGATQGISKGVMGLMMLGGIGGFIVAMVTIFNKKIAGVTAPMYALLEGLFLGGLSAFLEMRYPGIVIQAVALTFGTLLCLLAAYKSGLIKVTENFKLGMVAAMGAIIVVYIVSILMSFFGGHSTVLSFTNSSPLSIGFSLFVVTIAALNLVLDFDFIERGSEMGAPKYMEWYAAFGLMVTLVWLYIEILRLLSKLASRR